MTSKVTRKKIPASKNQRTPVPALPAKQYHMKPSEVVEVGAYLARKELRRTPANIKILKQEGQRVDVTLAPACDEFAKDETAGKVAIAHLANTLGIASGNAALEMFYQIMNGTRTKEKVDQGKVNAALGLIADIAPTDAVEAMLAVQMVGVNSLIAQLQQRVVNSVETIPQLEANGGLLVKLLRTFTAQTEALKRYRTGGEQRVSVTHQHVTVNADKAAVAVNPPPATDGAGVGVTEKTEEQPHAPQSKQLAYAPGDPLPGTVEADGKTVSEPGR